MADILILGGGVSGLTAGIYSLLSGHKATVCEKNGAAGGNLTGWDRDGYHIDNCIHWLTGTNPNTDTYKTWETVGMLGETEIYRPNSLYTCECCGITLSLDRDLLKFKKSLLDLSPVDKKEIGSLIAAIDAVRYISGTGGRRNDRKSTPAKTAAALPKLYGYYKMTAGELSERFRHPLIKKFLSSFLSKDSGAIALICVFAAFCSDNADYPSGGSLKAAERIVRRFLDLGGVLLTNKEATGINAENGRVISVDFADETRLEADFVIAAAEPLPLFRDLLKMPLPEEFEELIRSDKYERFSSFQCAFSCPAEEVPFEYDMIVDVPEKYKSELKAECIALREFSFEPGFAPPGMTVIQSMSFFCEKDCINIIKASGDKKEYKRIKDCLASATLAAIEEKLPKLRGKLKLIDAWTPATYKRYFGSDTGSYMSPMFSSGVLPRRIKNTVDGIENLILATQWLHPPGGLPNAAEAGKRAAETVGALIKNERIKISSRRFTDIAAAFFK